jgi:hypothetical protein
MWLDTYTLREWDLPTEQALAAARTNIRALGDVAEGFSRASDSHCYCSRFRDEHDTARLLLGPEFRKLPVRGDVVVVPVFPQKVLAAGSEEPDALADLVESSMSWHEHPQWTGGFPLVLGTDGRWQNYVPPPDSPVAPLVAELRKTALRSQWADQEPALAKACPQAQNTYVAPVLGGKIGLVAPLWLDRVNYVPATEHVLFFERGSDGREYLRGMANWDDVKAIAGARARRVGVYPERHVIEPALAAELADHLDLTWPDGRPMEAPVPLHDGGFAQRP